MSYKWNPFTKNLDKTSLGNNKVKMTPEGGLAIRLTNKTGATSIKGTLVEASTSTQEAVGTCDANCVASSGVVYKSGVADGSEMWVVVAGITEVLLKDTTSATMGYWAKTSDTAGRADITNAAPPGGGIPQHDEHSQEIGHCIQSVTAGTNKLCKVVLHFN